MGFAKGIVLAKALLDGGACFAFMAGGNAPMAWMFFGFTIADFGCLGMTP